MADNFRYLLKAVRMVADETAEATFAPVGRGFDFIAGQYMRVTIPWAERDEKGNSRDFSIASYPAIDEMSIVFRVSGSAFKKALLDGGSLGKEVQISGPYGNFVLPPDYSRGIVFIAGGVGISPFLSMAKFALGRGLSYKMHLLYFNKNIARAAYLDELDKISRDNPAFTYESIYGPVDEKNLAGRINPEQDSIYYDKRESQIYKQSSHIWAERSRNLYYIAGPPQMAYGARNILIKSGVLEEDILEEDFTGY